MDRVGMGGKPGGGTGNRGERGNFGWNVKIIMIN